MMSNAATPSVMMRFASAAYKTGRYTPRMKRTTGVSCSDNRRPASKSELSAGETVKVAINPPAIAYA